METEGNTATNEVPIGDVSGEILLADESNPRQTTPAVKCRSLFVGGVGSITAVADLFQQGIWLFTYQYFYSRGYFWTFTTAFILIEPILCSYDPYQYPQVYKAQTAVLILSTVCFAIQLVGSVAYRHLDRGTPASVAAAVIATAPAPASKFEELKTLLFTGAYVLELFTLLCGLIFLWWRPGIAALRCFRVFRILFYHELPEGLGDEKGKGVLDSVKYGMDKLFWFFGGSRHTLLVIKVMKFSSKCLQNMSQEMFFLTEQTRGGFILMVMLFYSAFVVGCAMWIETRDTILPVTSCNTLGSCVFTLLRLTFYDGNGLDFLWSLSADHKFLFAIVVIYLCSTAFGILNGLIGIFGDIFNDESDRIFVKDLSATAEDVDELNKSIQKIMEEFDRLSLKLDAVCLHLSELN